MESNVCSRSHGQPPGARNRAMISTARSKRSPVVGICPNLLLYRHNLQSLRIRVASNPEMTANGSRENLDGKRFDVVIIGGGINGAAIARVLARAGKSVLVVEQHDFGSGTTSRS